MATYREELTTLNDRTIARIYDNTTEDITGDVHQAEDLDQNGTFYGNLLPLRGDAFRVVRGGVTADPVDNFNALQAAYDEAKALTPYGNPLSATNRVTIILMPGTYDGVLEVDTEFIDFKGLGVDASDTVLTTSDQSSVIKSVDDVHFGNLTIATTSPVSNPAAGAFHLTTLSPNEVFDHVSFVAPVKSMTTPSGPFLMSGNYNDCTSNTSLSFLLAAGGVCRRCVAPGGGGAGDSSFSGSDAFFYNCKCSNSGFRGQSFFYNCTGGTNSFSQVKEAYNCIGGNGSFELNGLYASHIENCIGGNGSFCGTGHIGDVINCTGGTGCFVLGTLSGRIAGCRAGDGSFQVSTVITGTIDNCDFRFSDGQRILGDGAKVIGCRLTYDGIGSPTNVFLLNTSASTPVIIYCTFLDMPSGYYCVAGDGANSATVAHCTGGADGTASMTNNAATPYNVFIAALNA